MSRITKFAAVLFTAVLTLPATAQKLQAFGGDGPRFASTRIFWNDGPVGMVCIQYGQPQWKDEYDGMVDQLKGKMLRLGKDFWTTLNTSCALTIGETEVAPGSYYLGLKCDEDGGFHLLILDAVKADKAGWAPFVPDAWKPDYTIALTHSRKETSTELMYVGLSSDENAPASMKLTIAWGKHVLATRVLAHIGDKK